MNDKPRAADIFVETLIDWAWTPYSAFPAMASTK